MHHMQPAQKLLIFLVLISVTPLIKVEYRVDIRNNHNLVAGDYLVFVWTYIILSISQLGSLLLSMNNRRVSM